MGALIVKLVAGIGLKDYIYAGVLAALLAGFTWYSLHERSVGAQKVVAADTKVAVAAEKHNAAVTATAQTASNQIGQTYAQAITAPVPALPHVLCERTAPAGSQLPQATNNSGSADGTANVSAAAPVDIGPGVVAVGADADDQVRALQAEIQVLLDAMNGVTK